MRLSGALAAVSWQGQGQERHLKFLVCLHHMLHQTILGISTAARFCNGLGSRLLASSLTPMAANGLRRAASPLPCRLQVEVWGPLAERVEQELQKGDRLAVQVGGSVPASGSDSTPLLALLAAVLITQAASPAARLGWWGCMLSEPCSPGAVSVVTSAFFTHPPFHPCASPVHAGPAAGGQLAGQDHRGQAHCLQGGRQLHLPGQAHRPGHAGKYCARWGGGR